ncbi:MAG TPA: peptide deformylase [Candidatus Nanoarchaeia archaeon]|nr:peptide deformylase [Candidatus Nanoarchaeia archaeon]
MVKISEREDPVLRQTAAEVPISEIKGARIQKVISDMQKALATQDDGVAICAPQIGVSLRMFVVSGRTLADINGKEHGTVPDKVFINPKFVKLSKKTEWMEEGCLSLRYLYGKVKRSTQARVSAYDENGQKFEFGGSGLLAQIFQHETDHLNGVLFTDTAVDVVDLPPEPLKDEE